MLKKFNFALIVIFCLAGVSSAQRKIVNLDVAKNAVKHYYESGNYYKDLSKILTAAESKINKMKLPKNAAIIFDVDDTALSGYDYTKAMGFGFTFKSWIKWIKLAKARAILPVKKFYNFAISKNIKVVFLTGRQKKLINATRKNLINAGYFKFDTLICREKKFDKLSAAKFKLEIRKKLTEEGYNIIATIGDQQSDIAGSFTGLKIKIPNYLYIIK